MMAGLTDDQTALIMGWTSQRVAAIRDSYVNAERVITNLAEKLRA